MESVHAVNYLTWLLTLSGGVVLIGAVAALSSDAGSPFPGAYKLAWTAIALEVFSLLVALYALAVGPYRNWKQTVVALLAMVTAVLVPITNNVLQVESDLPGSNGSDARANAAAAGLIVVMAGNIVQILLAGMHGDGGASAVSHKETV
ncbi:O-antigen polymerase [Micractinium conductrix]|uniref:O-antigen polymerase n=1 Tax=Micractinium conductrix TaxID=554055 RepID=A0A2P6VSJ2_9CHLO|nr:O-antigen polymerase [Micractinium conductrix]|eukprot:PSC77047.1 O-antigen polymerase [Micractinium conductrix]